MTVMRRSKCRRRLSLRQIGMRRDYTIHVPPETCQSRMCSQSIAHSRTDGCAQPREKTHTTVYITREGTTMKIAITTPTGNIGSKLTDRLLETGEHDLVLLARKPESVSQATDRGATVVTGDLADRDYVIRATEGVDALFWVNPPNYTTDDFAGFYRNLTENAVAAIKQNKIKRVVVISSIGAHLGEGVGPVNAFKQVEQLFRDSGAETIILRPTYFMENLMQSAPSIAEAESIFLPVSGGATVSMIATDDIADASLKALTDGSMKSRVWPLHGPKDYSFDEAAKIIGDTLGKNVKHVQIDHDQALAAMKEMGVSEHVAGLFVEMHEAIDTGRMQPEYPRSDESTTPTPLESFVKTTMAPAIKQ
ncbi:NAD(P)H-binding protein [candidate division GN15 bacterium]|nr:NAD(P)H-binding protein [candidate division GN15 bacterium]